MAKKMYTQLDTLKFIADSDFGKALTGEHAENMVAILKAFQNKHDRKRTKAVDSDKLAKGQKVIAEMRAVGGFKQLKDWVVVLPSAKTENGYITGNALKGLIDLANDGSIVRKEVKGKALFGAEVDSDSESTED